MAKMNISVNALINDIHNNAVQHGWWEDEKSDGEAIALMHSELSEALESLRNGEPESKKIPGFTETEEELADTIIRIFDYCGKRKLRIVQAIYEKHQYNKTRPYKHGRKRF